MLIDNIRKDRMYAMKHKNVIAKSILTTLLGELEGMAKRTGDPVTDELVVQTAKKFVASNDEVIAIKPNPDLVLENCILHDYIPSQLSETELRMILKVEGIKNIGQGMGFLKKTYNGQYDGKMASRIIKEIV